MELSSNYYSLDECREKDLIIGKLEELKVEGKIEYSIDIDILEIKDLDLNEKEIDILEDLLYDNDVIPYEVDDFDDDFDDFYDFDDGDIY